MGKVKNVLFIMCDQLRADHLSCAGHPHLKTPAIDALAARDAGAAEAALRQHLSGTLSFVQDIRQQYPAFVTG